MGTPAKKAGLDRRSLWIGDPFDPEFEWRRAQPRRPTPRAISDLPPSDRLWQALGRRFEQGHLAARLTEADDWIGLATRRELDALVEETFAGVDDPALPELRRVVRSLDHRTIYYLVAARSGRPRRSEGAQ